MGGTPAHGRGIGTKRYLRSLPTKSFYDNALCVYIFCYRQTDFSKIKVLILLFPSFSKKLLQHPELSNSQLLADFLSPNGGETQFLDKMLPDVNLGM